MSGRDRQQIETRLQAAFDRFNRAVIGGAEPTPDLFLEALHDEGLRLSLAGSPAEAVKEPASGVGRSAWAGRAKGLLPRGSGGS